MIDAKAQIRIEVPRDDVFAYMDQPTNQLEITPSVNYPTLLRSV